MDDDLHFNSEVFFNDQWESVWVFFSSKRGVRQGDHMPPYVFVLGVEYLTRLLKNKHYHPQFKFHPKCKSLKLTHVAFADDMMVICHADRHSPLLLKAGFDKFAEASGLSINVQKSQLFLADVDANTK